MNEIHPIFRIMCDCFRICFRELFDGEVFGDEYLPQDGAYLLAGNHVSFWDPPFVGSSVVNREVFPFARKTLFRTKFRNWLFSHMNCIPVDREGSDITAMKRVLNLLKDGQAVLIFPEGTRSDDGTIHKPRAGIGLLAGKTKVPVVPCKVFGAYEIMNKFSSWPDWDITAHVIFGKPIMPIEFEQFNSSANKNQDIADYIMQRIDTLTLPIEEQM